MFDESIGIAGAEDASGIQRAYVVEAVGRAVPSPVDVEESFLVHATGYEGVAAMVLVGAAVEDRSPLAELIVHQL